MAKCCISKVSLKGTWEAKWPFGTEIYARLFYVSTDETEVLLVAMDSSDTFRREAIRFREGVAKATGIPADHIWYHELQLHAAPVSVDLQKENMDKVIACVSKEVNDMKKRAVTFTCEVAEIYTGRKYTINREQYVAGLGGVTLWAGMFFDEKGRPYIENPDRMLLRGYKPNLPVFEKPIYFDNNNDPLAYLFVFKDEGGETIGTISRFAAHPDVAVLFELQGVDDEYHYDYDWPGYLSDKLERHFRAPSMYLNGPCADLATKKNFYGYVTYEMSAGECRRLGEEFADMLIEGYHKKTVNFGNPDNCKAARFVINLPIKEDFPYSMEELKNWKANRVDVSEKNFQDAIANDEPAYRVKQLADERYRAEYIPRHMDSVNGVEEEDLRNRTRDVDVTALQLGNYLFVGVPGESLVEMTEWLRSTLTGTKTIPVDQVNGYYGYMATPASLTKGGYTYWHSFVNRESVPKLKAEIQKEMEKFLEQ